MIKIANVNPLPAESNIEITIPDDFDVNFIDAGAVTLLGSNFDSYPLATFDPETGRLTVSKINSVPLKSGDFIYVVVGPVTNPTDTEPTSSFSYLITDNLGNSVETVDTGITFSASAGGFSVIELEMDILTINEPGASYTFTL